MKITRGSGEWSTNLPVNPLHRLDLEHHNSVLSSLVYRLLARSDLPYHSGCSKQCQCRFNKGALPVETPEAMTHFYFVDIDILILLLHLLIRYPHRINRSHLPTSALLPQIDNQAPTELMTDERQRTDCILQVLCRHCRLLHVEGLLLQLG